MTRDPQLQLYLAQHYYSGPKADAIAAKYGDGHREKKKKRKVADDGALTIRDESEQWPVDHDEVVAEAPKLNTSAWTTVGQSAAAPSPAPVPTPAPAPAPAPATAPRAGLMSREEIRAQREARRAAEEARRTAVEDAPEPQETVYRDERGRRINVEDEEARLRAELETEAQKEKERATWTQGLKQRSDREAQAAELDALRAEGVTRGADDRRMNDALREREHWDDPARHFLARKRGPRVTRPQYEGPPPPPNRFGIKPGYRWDGVDRSNGFERKLFAAISERERRRDASQAWTMQDL